MGGWQGLSFAKAISERRHPAAHIACPNLRVTLNSVVRLSSRRTRLLRGLKRPFQEDETEMIYFLLLLFGIGVGILGGLLGIGGGIALVPGLMLLFGWQVRRDVAEAARWYELAARQGDVRSQAQISSMYASGQGVPQDLVAAYKWLGVAAKAGDAQSVDRLPRLARQLSEAELARAEALVKAWRPGR